MQAHENKVVSDIVYGANQTLLNELTSRNFDAFVSLMMPFEQLIGKKLGLPCMRWMSFQPNIVATVFNRDPWDLSSNYPLFAPS